MLMIRTLLVPGTFLLALLLPRPSLAQLANVTPAFLDFGPVKMGATVTVPLTVSNLSAFSLALAGGGISGDVGMFAQGGTCSGTLGAGSSCTFNYHFRPKTNSSSVTASTMLQISGGGQFQNAALMLRGSGNESLIRISPRSIDFGEELIGQTVSVPVTLTNTHDAAVMLAGGGIGSPFSSMGGTPACSGSLAPGASCVIDYRFTPAQQAEVIGSTNLQISDASGLLQSYSIGVRGRGRNTPGMIGVVPLGVDFGDIKLGDSVETRVFATNRTAAPLTRAGGGFNDDDNAFLAQSAGDPGCGGGAHPAGATCSTRYFFTPRAARAHAASAFTTYTQPGETVGLTFQFSGTGVGTLARVSPIEIDFGQIRASTQVSVPVTLRNTSTATLTSILGGDVSGVFSRTTTCGSTLAVGASCTLTYRFQPPPGVSGDHQTQTVLSYTNISATQETVSIVLSGQGTVGIFADGFE